MKQSGYLNPSEETGTGCPVTSKYGRTPPNKHGGVGRQQEHNKALFRITHSLLSDNHKEQLSNCKGDRILANQFACFFEDNIERIRKNFIIHNHSDETPNTIPHLRDLNPASCEEVQEVILSSPNKTCDLDPMPTWLMKKCIDQLLLIITGIINSSITSGCFPN